MLPPRSEPPRRGGSAGVVYDLSAGVPAVVLEERGLRVVRRPGRLPDLVPYADVTHVAVTDRGFWMATVRRAFFARRERFREQDGPERLARDVLGRVAAGEGGLRQLSQMATVERLARRPFRVVATLAVAVVCLGVFALQARTLAVSGLRLEFLAAFDPPMVARGEWWRLVSGHFLHAPGLIPLHLLFNLIGLLGFGYLVERALGPARTALLLGVAGVAAMAASGLVRSDPVVGASGLVAGLVGGALCLELHRPRRLPAWWRLPRRLFLALLALQVVLDASIESIAGEAHLGGFAGGYAMAWLLATPGLRGRPASLPLRTAAVGVLAAALVAAGSAWPLLSQQPAALAEHGRRLLAAEREDPQRENAVAWILATHDEAEPGQLEVAVALAERAVSETDRQNPDVLDTLAEAHFAAGQREKAVEVIDEAIALAPEDEYFREQRRRFTGERPADDRPEPPSLPWPWRQPPEGEAPGGESGEAEPEVEV